MVANEAEVTWNLEYSSHPPLMTLQIFDSHGNEIAWISGGNPKPKFEVISYQRMIIFTIRNITIADAGKYTFLAANEKIMIDRKLSLKVRGDSI